MAAPNNLGDYTRRGEVFNKLGGKSSPGGFDYFRRGEPFLARPPAGTAWTFAAISTCTSSTRVSIFRVRKIGAGRAVFKMIIPGYIYPDAPGTAGRLAWDAWTNAPDVVHGIIVNPGSPGGPGTFTDTNYQAVIANAVAAGVTPYGYIDTTYASPEISTPVLDDFNTTANQLLTARTGWHATALAFSDTSLKVSTPTPLVAQKSTGTSGSNFWATNYTNCEARAKFGGQTGTGNVTFLGVFTRYDPATGSGYFLEFYLDGTYVAGRLNTGSSSIYRNHIATGITPGFDEICLRSIGQTHQIWYKVGSGSWTMLDSFEDSTSAQRITGPGLIGLRSSATGTVTIDRFAGGEVATTPKQQVLDWVTYYGIHDIFIDQVTSDVDNIPYIKNLIDYIRGNAPNVRVIINCGNNPDESYMPLADVVCTFEGPETTPPSPDYDSYTKPTWWGKYEPGRFLHLVYNIPDAASMLTQIDKAISLGAGNFYGVDTNIWFATNTLFGGERSYFRSKLIASSGVVTGFINTIINANSVCTSTGVVKIVRARKLIAISSGLSSGVCAVGRGRSNIASSICGSTGTAGIVRARTFNAISNSTAGSALCAIRRARTFGARSSCGSTGVATFAPGGIRAVCTSTSSGRASLIRTRKFGADSWGDLFPGDIQPGDEIPSVGHFSTGIVTPARTRTFAAISTGSSSGRVSIVRNRGLHAFSTTGSTGTCGVVKSGVSAYVSRAQSTGTVSLARTRRFSATAYENLLGGFIINGTPLGSSTSSGIATFGQTKLITAISTGSSTGTAKVVRARTFAAVSNGTTGSARCGIVRGRTYGAVSGCNSTGTTGIVRARTFGAISTDTSTGILTFNAQKTFVAICSGSSTGRTSIVRNRALSVFSSGTSSGLCSVGRGRGVTCLSNGNSTGVASIVRNRALRAVSLTGSTGICSVAKLGTNAYVSQSQSTGTTGLVRNRSLHAISSGSSGGVCNFGTHFVNLVAISNTELYLGETYLDQLLGYGHHSTGVVTLGINHGLTAISTGTSSGTCSIVRARTFGAVSRDTSTGNVSFNAPTKTMTAVSGGTSGGVCGIGRKRTYACTSNTNSTGIASLTVQHAFAAISTDTSGGVTGCVRKRNLGVRSSGSSTGLCSFASPPKTLFAISSFELYLGDNTYLDELLGYGHNSTGTAQLHTPLGPLRAVSACSSSGQTNLVRIRNFAAVSAPLTYDQLVLADNPVAYWTGANATEISGNGMTATLQGTGTIGTAIMPNGDTAAVFNGIDQFFEVNSDSRLSIDTTGQLTLEAWVRPDVNDFLDAEPSLDGPYVNYIGKGEDFGVSGHQEYYLRMYSKTGVPLRPNRTSGYAFNPAGGLGVGSFAQDPITPRQWIHIVVIYDTAADTTRLYKNGVLRDSDSLSAGAIVPVGGPGKFRIGTTQGNTYDRGWFLGALGKVAVYNYALSANQIKNHYLKQVPAVAKMSLAHSLVAVSGGSSAGTCSFAGAHTMACVSGGTSSGTAALTRTRALNAFSTATSRTTCGLTTVGFHAYVADGTSTGVSGITRKRSLFAVSQSSPGNGQCSIVRTRRFAATANNTSSALWYTATTQTFACISGANSTGRTNISRERGFAANSNGASSAQTKVVRNRAFFASSTQSASGICSLRMNHGLNVRSTCNSTAIVRIGKNSILKAVSVDRSTGKVAIGDLNIAGTMVISDNIAYTLVLTDYSIANISNGTLVINDG